MTMKPDYILLRANENGDGFRAFAIGLDGCVSEGRTEEESIANLKAAIDRWNRSGASIAPERPRLAS